MSKNQNRPNTVIVPQSTIDLTSMTPAELQKYALSLMTPAEALKSTAEATEGIKTVVSAEVLQLQTRNTAIDAEIESLTAHLREEKKANIIRLSELNAKGVAKVRADGEAGKASTPCPTCPSKGRHSKDMQSCETWKAWQAVVAQRAAEKLPYVNFDGFLKTREVAAQ